MAVKLNAARFEELILRRGRKVKWQEAITCSCSRDGHPSYECQACKGMGTTLSAPIEDVVLLQSVTHNQDFEAMAGIFEIGDAVMTVGFHVPHVHPTTKLINKQDKGRKNPIFQVGQGDLITLTDDEYKTSEVLVKGMPIYNREADTMLNEDIVEVLRIQIANQDTGEVTVYVPGEHFDVEGNRIVWEEGTAPEMGTSYTVVYLHRPVFTVFTQLPTPRYQDGQDLPKKVALRYRAGGVDRR